MEVVASLSQGRTAAAQCGLFTHKSVPVIIEPPCILVSNGKAHLSLYVKAAVTFVNSVIHSFPMALEQTTGNSRKLRSL